MKRHAAPIIAAVLLLLPAVLYVGSYLALVKPDTNPFLPIHHYRVQRQWLARIFWPLEQIDRKLRPWAWDPLLIDTPSFHDRRSDP